jgi:hypothetical protein
MGPLLLSKKIPYTSRQYTCSFLHITQLPNYDSSRYLTVRPSCSVVISICGAGQGICTDCPHSIYPPSLPAYPLPNRANPPQRYLNFSFYSVQSVAPPDKLGLYSGWTCLLLLVTLIPTALEDTLAGSTVSYYSGIQWLIRTSSNFFP